MKLSKTLIGVCLGSTALLMSQAIQAQQIKASEVHPEGYPNVEKKKKMGEKLQAATNGRL
ncbi:TRAP transporter substrate-binding protein, partial [Dickeya dadantii]|nr:TRAP transporter substrate-binding protein [Dickeya dadantii]